MSLFIAVASIDPARNELTQAFVRATQDEADAMAAANARPNLPWVVFELVECSRADAPIPRVTRSRIVETTLAGEANADTTAATDLRSEP